MRLIRIAAMLLVLSVGIVAGLLPLLSERSPSQAEEVLFEPALSRGPDPFTAPAVRASGPYGGTGSDEECDQELLISFLTENPDRLRAWAKVHDLDPSEVPSYIRSLRPVVLSEDTRVTNHGFRAGRANPFQSTLSEGTAVLVDEDGKIVVRCRCGNPLDIPDCPDCEKTPEECPERLRRLWGEDCEPPEDCPEDQYATHGFNRECEPPDEDCPERVNATHGFNRECEPPDEDCPEEVYATHGHPRDCERPEDDDGPRRIDLDDLENDDDRCPPPGSPLPPQDCQDDSGDDGPTRADPLDTEEEDEEEDEGPKLKDINSSHPTTFGPGQN
jgi:hypothetical protein